MRERASGRYERLGASPQARGAGAREDRTCLTRRPPICDARGSARNVSAANASGARSIAAVCPPRRSRGRRWRARLRAIQDGARAPVAHTAACASNRSPPSSLARSCLHRDFSPDVDRDCAPPGCAQCGAHVLVVLPENLRVAEHAHSAPAPASRCAWRAGLDSAAPPPTTAIRPNLRREARSRRCFPRGRNDSIGRNDKRVIRDAARLSAEDPTSSGQNVVSRRSPCGEHPRRADPRRRRNPG